jgi:hypothetical protein
VGDGRLTGALLVDPQPDLGFTRVVCAQPGFERRLAPEGPNLLRSGTTGAMDGSVSPSRSAEITPPLDPGSNDRPAVATATLRHSQSCAQPDEFVIPKRPFERRSNEFTRVRDRSASVRCLRALPTQRNLRSPDRLAARNLHDSSSHRQHQR